jgi:uncharacterized LabA/DUF88 family protein
LVEQTNGPDCDVGLFIDWENFKYSLYEVGRMPNVTALIQAVRERYGRPALARAYADWQDYYHRKSADQMNLYAAGIEPVYVPSRRGPGQQDRIKNSVDVRMSLDCLEVSFTHAHLQTFVLVAGDADFQHVVGALRRRGARVIMIGVSGSTALRLAAVVDDLLFYDVDIEKVPPITPEVVPSRSLPSIEDEKSETEKKEASALAETPWPDDEQLAAQQPEFADIVLTADDIENSHREYMGRSLLARFLYNKGHWDPANLPARAAPLQSHSWQAMEMPDIYRLLDVAVEKDLLTRTTFVDPNDGYEIQAVEMNRAHPFVRHVLSTLTS